jgi:hypothetical protein
MKTVTVKIDNVLVRKAMKRGGFKKPDEAVSYWLKTVIETPEKLESRPPKTHHPKVIKMTGILKTDDNLDDLRRKALEEKYLK